MAYPATANPCWSRVQLYLRHNTRAVGATVAFLTFLLVMTSDYLHDTSVVSSLRGGGGLSSRNRQSRPNHSAALLLGASRPGYFTVADSITDTGFHFGMVTDLDQLSKLAEKSKPLFQSHLVPGFLQKTGGTGAETYQITFDDTPIRSLVTGHNEAGRGAEFSELTVFDNRLLTFDDRTGDVFEILNTPTGDDSYCVPRLVLTEGAGDTDKGMKWEWSTVKDGELYMGSMGKEYTNSAGEIVNVNNLWIAVLQADGSVRRENWRAAYEVVRRALGAAAPGYIIVEAVNWSEALQKWVFMPRRISSLQYDDVEDEKRGGRKLVLVDADFSGTPTVIDLELSSTDPLKGFSSFSFVPGTNDRHLLAIRSVEENCAGDDLTVCQQRSYLVALETLTGKQLSPEVQYGQNWKFEGLEFFNPYVKAPASSQ